MKNKNEFNRGSIWRQWDLHIHSPASFHWAGQKFGADEVENRTLVDEMISALNDASPAVFALMDYWTFDGWFALRRRLSEPDAPKLKKVVFPGIELRLMAPMRTTNSRLNAHVIFSNTISDQALLNFKADLKIELIDTPLSDEGLVLYARNLGRDKLERLGFQKEDIDKDDEVALRAGSMSAEIGVESYKTAIVKVPNNQAIGFMPFDTNDGLADVKWEEHYAFSLGLFKHSPIFETRNDLLRSCFLCEETDENKAFIHNFQSALDNVPRLVVSGSDAHQFKGIKGDNNKRGYGDYPSGKVTWIKSDPTFLGLRQAIMEPSKRSYIGELPSKLREVETNKTFVIDRLKIDKCEVLVDADWLDETNISFNPDLVAIIGNKGSGKSALADIIALLGNSRQKQHFSFLQKNRFRGKAGVPAKHFVGELSWLDSHVETGNLNEDSPYDKVEMVTYIPQGHFEELCNAHVSGSSNAFENELRAVVFSHVGQDVRLGALDFEQLIEKQEKIFRNSLTGFRADLRKINLEIEQCENQAQIGIRNAVLEKIVVNKRRIDEYMTSKPVEVLKPTSGLTPEQEQVNSEIEKYKTEIVALNLVIETEKANSLAVAGRVKAVANIRERLRVLKRAYSQFGEDSANDLETLTLSANDLVKLAIDEKLLDRTVEKDESERNGAEKRLTDALERKKIVGISLAELNVNLNAPELEFHKYLAALQEWTDTLADLIGGDDIPETQLGLKARLDQLDKLPGKIELLCSARLALTGEIFLVLDSQRAARASLFMPVQDLIQNNELIRNEYKLQFQANLKCSAGALASSLFDLIKQNSGEFRGAEDGYRVIQELVEVSEFNKSDGVLAFTSILHNKLAAAAKSTSNIGISSLLRKDRSAVDVYDFIFGLPFLEPGYSLLFQEAQIEQLSPGQRGALLLIFYLLVDKGRKPIILDQPEENLDNETVVSLLVPVLTEAKKRRQIIMVTHNPNLAVVCDAEQIIWSKFDRKNGSKISYETGSIENSDINAHVVKILEGTMPAFNNRRSKYHPAKT